MKQLLALTFTLIIAGSLRAEISQVEASIDKNPVMVDEAIRLTVTAQGDADRDAFDSSPLLKDFVVGRTSVSSRTSIVNFSTTQTTTWSTTLFPRSTGTLTIPALTIEDKQTQPIELEVLEVQQGSGQPARDYYVTAEVDTDSVYLHQQIRYTVKLFLASDIERGSLQAPELVNAQIKQLGNDKQYSEIINGRRYQVIERNFAVIPQQSGDLNINGPVFSGEVIAPNTNQRFGFFNRTQQINRLGPDIQISVQPVPPDIDYHWLPSEFVRLDEEWQEDGAFVVGEPVTRTITLTAMGVVEEQLPELPAHYPPDFKLYPDQPGSATVDKDNTLIAQRKESTAIIPTRTGKYVLPELTVPWFNVLTGETEYATLPARSIEVQAAAASSATGGQLPAVEPTTEEGLPRTTERDQQPTAGWPSSLWFFVLLGLWLASMTGWLATVFYYRRKGSTNKASGSKVAASRSSSTSEAKLFEDLKAAIKAGNPGPAEHKLLLWLNAAYPKTELLHRPAQWSATAPLQPYVDNMLASAYGKKRSEWDRKAFIEQLQRTRKQLLEAQRSAPEPLPALYPK